MSHGRDPKNDFPSPPAIASLSPLGWAAVLPEMVTRAVDEARRPPRDAWHRRLRKGARVMFGRGSHIIGWRPGLGQAFLRRGLSRAGILAAYAAVARRIVS
jgi:hypothetical protein